MFAMLVRRPGKAAGENPCGSSASDFMTRLYQKYKAVLYRKAGAYTPDPCAREDIVQEALLRLVHNAARLETLDPPALMSYMTLTVRSAALNYLRAEHRERLDAVPLPEDDAMQEAILPEFGTQLTLEEQMLLGHRNEEIRAAIRRLPERDQILLVGKYFLELDNRELSGLLDVTPGGLRVLLYRARNRALKELVKEGVLHEQKG